MKQLLTLFIILSAFCTVGAATDNAPDSLTTDSAIGDAARRGTWSLQLDGNMGRLMHDGPDIKKILHSYNVRFYDMRLKWQADRAAASVGETNAYDRAMNFPRLQLGLMYADMSSLDIGRPQTPYKSEIGHILTLYGGIGIDLWRSGRWSAGIDLQNGVGYCPHPYDINHNDDQWIIGSRFTIFVNLGAHLRYQLSPKWAVAAGMDFKHYSNGTLDRPNLGANSYGPTLAVEYAFDRPKAEVNRHSSNAVAESADENDRQAWQSEFYLDATAGLGMRALIDRFVVYHTSHHPIYGFPSVIIAPMWRWNLLHATGISLDYSYVDYVYRIRTYDRMRHRDGAPYSPHVLGLALRHEVFYKHMSLNVGLGCNLHKHLGFTSQKEESWFYQNVGLRYTLPFGSERLYLGYNIKAHKFSKVDHVAIVAGYRFRLARGGR